MKEGRVDEVAKDFKAVQVEYGRPSPVSVEWKRSVCLDPLWERNFQKGATQKESR